jgi:hypothetical protein
MTALPPATRHPEIRLRPQVRSRTAEERARLPIARVPRPTTQRASAARLPSPATPALPPFELAEPSLAVPLPNLLFAGVTHARVPALAQALALHPQVCLPAVRRVDHFAPLRYGRSLRAPLEDYRDHFANWTGQRYRLESSPVYFDGGRRLVSAVAQALPDVRVVVVLRNPAERLWTSYTDKVTSGRLPRAMSYETFVERCLALRANGTDRYEGNRYFRTLSSGFYVEHLPGWLAAFGDRARVVFAEDLASDPEVGTAGLLRWLGLEAEPRQGSPSGAGPDGGMRPACEDAVRGHGSGATARRSGGFAAAMGRVWPALRLATGAMTAPDGDRRPIQRPSERMLNRVESLYAGANRELAALLRDRGCATLPDWLTRP